MKVKSRFIDAFLGLFLTLAVAGSYILQRGFLESLELKYFDLRTSLITADVDVPEDIVIIAIDDDSITRLGRWPWPRTRIAKMLRKLGEAEPRVIGLDILYTEKAENPAFKELEGLEKKYLELVGQRKIIQRRVNFELEFSSAARRIDSDAHLLAAMEATDRVVLPMFFKTGGITGGRPPSVPEALSKSSLSVRIKELSEGAIPPLEASKVTYPIEPFLHATSGVGHVSIFPDLDGVVRRETPVIKYGKEYYPSYALQLVATSMGLSSDEIEVTPGESITIGNMTIPLDETQSMMITYNGGARTFRYFKFYEVMADDFDMGVFKDKIVILGPSASGIATLYVTPLSLGLPAVEYIANVAENILNARYITRPEWALQAELGAIGVIGLFVMIVLPRLGVLSGLFLTTLLMGGMLGAGFYVFQQDAFWLKVVYPSFLLGVGYVVIMVKNFFTTEQDKERVEGTQADTNKQLGLQFQSQGMLDLAFEKLRTCPVDDSMKETLYNLSLDFERKRQYAKAVSVYQYIAKEDKDYKDIQAKMKTLQAAAEGAVFGGLGGGAAKEGTIFAGGGASKPTLGRYEIEKELGRGAMGVVYLGQDPKINRKVAIKTLMLEEGDDPNETKEVKERFFREAESAGTLNHPGIVRIFDAGEDNDLCWIAMELLDGEDFVPYTKKDKLMSIEKVLEHIATFAEALDYAHSQGIVHRDIKPANLMLLKDGKVRITDFGIARIQASSKTATGTVMGTPSYMSPDQVAGKKVDGRSDLFSLGVTLYELLTGEKPFKGGEGIGTLLFQIANDPEPDILKVNPKLPPSIKTLIHRALMKKAEERYQNGNRFAKDIRACLEEIKGGAAAAIEASAPSAAVEPVPVVEPEPAVEKPPESSAMDIDLSSTTGSISKELSSIAGAAMEEKAAEPAPEPEPAPATEAPSEEVPPPDAVEERSAQPIENVADDAASDIAGSLVMPSESSEPKEEAEAPAADETTVLPPSKNLGGGQAGLGDSSPLSFDLDATEAPSEEVPPPDAVEERPSAPKEEVVEPAPAPEPAAPDVADETVVLAPAKKEEDKGVELPPEEFNADETLVLPASGSGKGGFTPGEIAKALPPADSPTEAPDEEKTLVLKNIESILPQVAPDSVTPEEMSSTSSLDDEIKKAQAKLAEHNGPKKASETPEPPSKDSGTGISLTDPEAP